eukprot:scaffold26088_cov132-Cylindrotheca_fusiformis.AAC.5
MEEHSEPTTTIAERSEVSRHVPLTEENAGQISNQPSPYSTAAVWNTWIQKYHKIILVAIVLFLWPFGFVAFKGLSSKTDSSFRKPIPNSPSAMAQVALERKFPNSLQDPLNPSIFVVLHGTTNTSIVQNPYVQNQSLAFQAYLLSAMAEQPNGNSTAAKIQVVSYFSFLQRNLTLLARPLLSSDEQTTLLQVQYTIPTSEIKKTAYTKKLMENIDAFFKNPPESVLVYITGLKYFSNDLRMTTKQDLKRMDMIVLPLALILVGTALLGRKSFISKGFYCIWIIPLCGMVTTVSTWSLITSAMADHVQITQFTPSIMMSLTLGMGIDYTLFLLARYLEKRQNDESASVSRFEYKSLAIVDMLQHGGMVVVVSGCTLLCTFLGLIGLPLVMLQSVGIGAAITIASAILANLLVVPSLLYTPLGDLILPASVAAAPAACQSPSIPDASGDEQESESNALTQPLLSDDFVPESSHNLQIVRPRESVWLWLSQKILHPYRSVICLLLLSQFLLSPLAWNAMRLKSTDTSFEALIPSDAPSLLAYRQLLKLGGPGGVAPFRILIDGTSNNATIDSNNAFDVMHQLIGELRHPGNSTNGHSSSLSSSSDVSHSLPVATVSGIAVIRNVPIPYAFYAAAKRCSGKRSSFCNLEVVRALNVIDESMTSNDRMATCLTVELSENPFADPAMKWLDLVRERIELLQREGSFQNFDIYIEGTAAIAHDVVTAVYSIFPWIIGITIAVVFVLLGLFFGSIVPPLRSVVSITCTLSASFGFAVLVYQDGLLNATHIRSFVALDPELCWLVPIMSFSIMVGLALDYDVFLVTRILEYRCSGYKHESSIAAGLDSTGGIITAAGIIMAVSFGSLLSSPSPALNQWSFLLTTCVLIDTFVVRTMVVPALMAIVGAKHAWYPRKLEVGHVFLDGFDDSANFSFTLGESQSTVE